MVVRFRAMQRLMLWHFYSEKLPLYLVTEFPKSGGTWFSKMLAECLEVPFPDPHAKPKLKSCVLRGTNLYSPRYKNVIPVMRDGRDIMVSAYYHFLFHNENNIPYGIQRTRNHLQFKDYEDVRANLPRFIEYMFTEFQHIGWSTRFTWNQFVDSWIDRSAPIVKYEELLSAPHETMNRVIEALRCPEIEESKLNSIVEKYSFRNMTGRNRGEEKKNTFARKGIAGDWKNYFSRESRQLFNHYAGEHLIKIGYEETSDWVDTEKLETSAA